MYLLRQLQLGCKSWIFFGPGADGQGDYHCLSELWFRITHIGAGWAHLSLTWIWASGAWQDLGPWVTLGGCDKLHLETRPLWQLLQVCEYGTVHVENAILGIRLGYLIDIFDLFHPSYVYPIPIFLAIKISSAKKVKTGISQDKERFLLQS